MNKSLTLLDGFMVGGGIVAAGFMLQLSAGPVNWDALTWPANAIMLAVFIATIIAIYMIGRKYVVPVSAYNKWIKNATNTEIFL